MNVELGKNVKQREGFSSFVPHSFPPKELFDIPQEILYKCVEATYFVGKLDGVKPLLPQIEGTAFAPEVKRGSILSMLLRREATASSQIEGTRAGMMDVLKRDLGLTSKASDVDNITHYRKALEYGMDQLADQPISLRITREVHRELKIAGTSAMGEYRTPGEFRSDPIWINGNSAYDARFVPPMVDDMYAALGEFEKFLKEERTIPALIHIGIAHAQFETIHPFPDGNGRVGRILITLLLRYRGLLETPVLALPYFFKRYQETYYEKLNDYHRGEVESWIHFFLEGVIETAKELIKISSKTKEIYDDDLAKIENMDKRGIENNLKVINNLIDQPVVNSQTIEDWIGLSRPNVQKVIDRFVNLGILESQHESEIYVYDRYVRCFLEFS